MTTLRHHLLDAQGKPIIAHPASVTPYDAHARPGTYRRTSGARAVSDNSGWLSWQLPLVPGQDAPIYYVTGIQADPVLIQVPNTATDVLVDSVRINTIGLGSPVGLYPSTPPVVPSASDPYVTETELAIKLAGQTGGGSVNVSDPALRSAFVPKWKASTAYAQGEPVLNPSGVIVTANAAHTSGTTYTPANWTAAQDGVYVKQAGVGSIQGITWDAYNALPVKDPATLYVITG